VFTTKEGKVLKEPVMAFGGGSHKCPGRFFIAYEMKFFLAALFSRFELRLAKGESVPPMAPAESGVGVILPARDVKMEIRRRK